MSGDVDLGYLLAVAAAGVCSPRPLCSWFRVLGSAREIVRHASSQRPPPAGAEPLSAEVLRRLSGIDDLAAGAALRSARACGAALLIREDAQYPEDLLKRLNDAPHVIYLRGCAAALRGRSVAIVGSRAATAYGRSMAGTLARELAPFGAAVVSGLARGVDAAAHRGALAAGLPTIAVLGSGLAALYPDYHAALAQDIVAAGGALVSEFAPHQHALPYHFPMRNRIVAALAHATIVVEAGMKSGALITARLADECARPVFAIPGDVGRRTSEGTNALIKDGVPLVTCGSEVAALMGWDAPGADRPPQPAGDPLVALLEHDGTAIDQLSERTGTDAGSLAARLTVLEIDGLVTRKAGGLFAPVSGHAKQKQAKACD